VISKAAVVFVDNSFIAVKLHYILDKKNSKLLNAPGERIVQFLPALTLFVDAVPCQGTVIIFCSWFTFQNPLLLLNFSEL